MKALDFAKRWGQSRLSSLFVENAAKNTSFAEENALQFFFGSIIPKKKYELTEDLIEIYKKYTIVSPGDIMINGLNLNYDFVSQRVALVKKCGIITSAYIALRLRDAVKTNERYYCYLLKAMDAKKLFHGMGTGIRLTLSFKDLKNVMLPVPPRPEQDQIVQFLDWKVSSINKIIELKQKQISTLKELMQAEIEKQLYAYPVEDTVRLRQLGTFFKGGGFSRNNLVEADEYPAILYGDIYTQYEYKTAEITHHIDGAAYSASRKISKGDIVMAGTGETKDEIGKSILYMGDESVAAGGDVIVFHPNEGINVEYLLYQLYSQSALKHRYINGKGDIIVHIYPTTLGNTIITLPGEADQNKVVAKINEIIDQVKEAVAVLTDEISVLREYRVCLIADTVTGKIDVRSVEIPEFEFADEDINNTAEGINESENEPPEEE